ncbi:MAG: outer membrane lipoprotein-sorting protein, partial [candidate division WOR-3 bacterium]
IEFTNPEDKGVKYLRLKKDLYIYLPDIDDVVRMSGDMLKQSFMGSDLSYEDLMQEDPLKYYKVTSLSDTIIEGSTYTILELLDTTATAPYYRVRMIVDVDRYIWLKEELYTKSGRKIKELEALNYRKIKGKLYPVETIIRDLRIKDSYTKFILKDVDFEIAVPANLFRIESLKR